MAVIGSGRWQDMKWGKFDILEASVLSDGCQCSGS